MVCWIFEQKYFENAGFTSFGCTCPAILIIKMLDSQHGALTTEQLKLH